MKNYPLLALALLCFAVAPQAQTFNSLQNESEMTISGTSTLHDWTSDVESLKASARLAGETIESASFEADVKSIKSGTSAMDNNTYKAMKADDHPKVSFRASDISVKHGETEITGKLTIAGHTETVKFPIKIERWSESHLLIEGSYALNMSTYGIDPPRAMMGAIRTGDEVVIAFKLNLYE